MISLFEQELVSGGGKYFNIQQRGEFFKKNTFERNTLK